LYKTENTIVAAGWELKIYFSMQTTYEPLQLDKQIKFGIVIYHAHIYKFYLNVFTRNF